MGTITTLPIEQNGRRPIERAGLEAAIGEAVGQLDRAARVGEPRRIADGGVHCHGDR